MKNLGPKIVLLDSLWRQKNVSNENSIKTLRNIKIYNWFQINLNFITDFFCKILWFFI